MEYTDFIRQMEHILELDTNTLKGTEALYDLPGWDSLAVLNLQSWVKTSFNLSFDVTAVASANTLEDIWRIITHDMP